MYKRNCLTLVAILTISLSSYSQKKKVVKDNLNVFFELLQKFEFKQSINTTNSYKNEKVNKELLILANIIFYAGQQKDTIVLNSVEDDDSNLVKSLKLLNVAYFELYNNPNRVNSFNNFINAITQSKSAKNNWLLKYSLYGILELYCYELVQTNEKHDIYLDELKQISNSNLDIYWLTIYKLILYTKTLNTFDKNRYNELVLSLDKLISQNTFNSKIKTKYYFKKGLSEQLSQELDSALYFYNLTLKNQDYPFLRQTKFSSLIKISEIHSINKNFPETLKNIELAKKYINLNGVCNHLP